MRELDVASRLCDEKWSRKDKDHAVAVEHTFYVFKR